MPACRDERGAAAVEFALVVPILILLIFGIAWFGIGYNRKQGLQAAAREGARLAALPQSTNTDITAKVNSALNGVLAASSSRTITVSPADTRPCDLKPPGTRVTVTVSAPFTYDVPLFGNGTMTMTGRGEFLCE